MLRKEKIRVCEQTNSNFLKRILCGRYVIEDKHDLKPNMMFSEGVSDFLLTYDAPKTISNQLLIMEEQKAQAMQFVQQIQRAL